MSTALTWLNEPPDWQDDARALKVRTGLETDLWPRTFYGFERDNGHFLHRTHLGRQAPRPRRRPAQGLIDWATRPPEPAFIGASQ